MKNKITAVALIAVSAGVFAYTRTHNTPIPSDLRDAVADSALEQLGYDKRDGNIQEPKPVAVRGAKLHVQEKPVKWIPFPKGKFAMGAEDMAGCEECRPIHWVDIESFEMSKTLVTVEQYEECFLAGKCTAPGTDTNSNNGANCNWGKAGRELHPVNCVTWNQANQYARFKGARLPTESEWEYAATGGGKSRKYPWGDAMPDCDKAVIGLGGIGCASRSTMPVCSKPDGNTAQGLCDMAGNVWQWVQDKPQNSYNKAPTDGSAFEAAGTTLRIIRGGSFYTNIASYLRAQYRNSFRMEDRADHTGFRLVRSR